MNVNTERQRDLSPEPENDSIVILFDGVCLLCNGVARFIADRDPQAKFKFAHIQSGTGAEIAERVGIPGPDLTSVVVVKEGRAYFRSTAALIVLGELAMPWRLARVFYLLPRPVRDLVYDFIGNRRYAWFGRSDLCVAPGGNVTERFLP